MHKCLGPIYSNANVCRHSYKIVQIAPQADTVEGENYVEKCHDASDVFIRQERSYLGLCCMIVGLATDEFFSACLYMLK